LTATGNAPTMANKAWSTAEPQKADTNHNYFGDLCSVAEKSLCLDKSGGAVSKLYSKRNNVTKIEATKDATDNIQPQPSNTTDHYAPSGMGWHNNSHENDPDDLPALISNQDIDSLKSLIEGDMRSFINATEFYQSRRQLNGGPTDDLGAAAAAIVDVKHFCYQCQRGGLVLTLGGKCPVCKGEFVEVEESAPQAGEWGVPTAPQPQPLTQASGVSEGAPTRAPKVRKPGMPLRKPQEASVKPYYCYNCKTKAPFLCSNNSKCPTCKSDFVEEHETATSHLEAEKEAEKKEDVAAPRRARRLSKYACHFCNKTSVVREGQVIKCGHCHSDFVEEKSESNATWADKVGTPEAKPVEPSNWQCHRCQRTDRMLVQPGEMPRCPFCNSEFVEQVIDQGPAGDAAGPTAPAAHLNGWNGAPQSWPPAVQPPREDAFFTTGREFIQRATSGEDLAHMEDEETTTVGGAVGGPPATPAVDLEKVREILDDVDVAAAKLNNKLKKRLGEDYCLKMSQCCQKPFQVVRRGGATGHDTLTDIHRKVKGHIRAVTVVIFNVSRGVETSSSHGDGVAYDEAVTELSSAIELLEKMCQTCWHIFSNQQLNRGGEYTLRIIRASCNVRCGELRAAKQDIALALAIHEPRDATPFFLRGMILKRQGKEDEATKDALAAVNLDPQLALKLSSDYM